MTIIKWLNDYSNTRHDYIIIYIFDYKVQIL